MNAENEHKENADEAKKSEELKNETETEGDRLLKRLKAKGYSNDKVGQAFVMKWSPPKSEKE